MKRVQRKRTKGWKMPPNTVYVGRPTKWGNPFKMTRTDDPDPCSREQAIEKYKEWLEGELVDRPDLLDPLKGKDLACWCRLDQPCHADVLLRRLKGTKEILNEIKELRAAIGDPVDVSLSNFGFYSKRIEELEGELERRALEERKIDSSGLM